MSAIGLLTHRLWLSGRRFYRSERSLAFTSRALRMPETADLEHVKAKYDNGVLSIEVRFCAQRLSHIAAAVPRR